MIEYTDPTPAPPLPLGPWDAWLVQEGEGQGWGL